MQNGDRLPSRTTLSKRLDSSRATVDKAIRELTEEGMLESRFGSGTFVARKLEGVVSNAEKTGASSCQTFPKAFTRAWPAAWKAARASAGRT